MILGSYVIYQSLKAMNDFYAASQLAPLELSDIHYVSNEMASANLEMAMLYHEAFDTLFS